ncbi:MAG TPA: hypothetical protein PKY38_12520 [Opitutaceae bacterium]|nr:hypothetical protein [Opitutaceae bacterium]
MKYSLAVLSALVIALCVLIFIMVRTHDARFNALETKLAAAAAEHEVGITMAWLQRWTDKLGRAADAGNWPLADFYLHEIDETAEDLIKAGVVDEGHDISALTRAMLLPVVESLESAVKARDAAVFDQRYTALIQTCNACHAATGHGQVQIARPSPAINPWNQDFRPAPAQP